MDGFYFVYVLRSEKDGRNYAGYTKNLELRFEQYNTGLEESIENTNLMLQVKQSFAKRECAYTVVAIKAQANIRQSDKNNHTGDGAMMCFHFQLP